MFGLIAYPPSNAKPLYYGIISDGTHTHPATLKIAHKVNPKGLVLVTDALSALGLPNGIHHLGDKQIEVNNSKAFIANTNTLCGSVTSLDKCVKYFIKATSKIIKYVICVQHKLSKNVFKDCSIAEAIETVTLHPAQVLGIQHFKGTLNYGADADFVLLGNELNVQSTWINGRCVFKHNNGPGYIERKKN